MHTHRLVITLRATGLIAAAWPACILAQQTAGGADTIEEVVVTAQKRVEKLIDVPVPVTVVTADQLTAQHVYSIADLERTAPSLEMVQGTGAPGGGGQIRGIGTNSFSRSAEGAVGIVVDGVPQGNVQGNSIYDVAQIEVLRGPQGTLFGLTASAGVINVTTVAPDPSGFNANVQVDLSAKGTASSAFGEQIVRAGLNFPLGESSAVRLAVNGDFLKGVQRNNYTGEDNTSNDVGFRVRYLWKSDRIAVNLSGDYDHRTQNYSDPQFVYANVDPANPLAGQLAACGITASWGNQSRCSSWPNHAAFANTGLSAQIDVQFEHATLTSITGWRRNELKPSAADIMGNPDDVTQIYWDGSVNNGRQISQELRLASPTGSVAEYTVGLFYSDYKASAGYTAGNGFNVVIHPAPGVYIPVVRASAPTQNTNKAAAAFGQVTWHVTGNLGLIGGLRYTHQKLTDYVGLDAFNPASQPSRGETSESNVSGKLGVQYKFRPDLNVYASYTRGYKGPQIIPAQQGNPTTKINAEIPNAYELGLKGALAGGRINYDANAFFTTVHDYQGQRCTINPVGALACIGESIPSVDTKGIELQLFGKPTDSLWLNAGFTYDKARFPSGWTGFDPSNLGNGTTQLGGLQLVNVPETKFNFSGEYGHGVGALEAYLGADTVYKSEMRMGYSADPRFVYPAHWTVGVRLGVRSPSRRFSAELFARNITNEHEPATAFGGPSFVPPGVIPFPPLSSGFVNGVSGWVTPASLRQVGLSVQGRW
ncbi:MAG: TonB-dependent receptor [Gammaproteobacteria bacterium]|nr:TonB-dependent receptor [Gammaproteobacteria bacterium]